MEFINYLEGIETFLDDCESEAVKDVLNTLTEEDIIIVYNYGCYVCRRIRLWLLI